MKITIKNPSPAGVDCVKWGDYHFGLSLQRALERQGATVHQHCWTEWDRDEQEDLIFVLRGKRRYAPPPGKAAVLWVISHPSTLTLEEIESYDLVFVASETHRQILAEQTKTPIRTLRQCTDTTLFTQDQAPIADRQGLLFVANSRGVQRNILRWSMEVGIRPKLIGRGWKGVGMGHWVTQDYIDNDKLPALYRASALGLNDHWADMAHYGYISNRIFDCLASGLPVLSDDFPELREVCGNGLLYASDPETFHQALVEFELYYPELIERTRKLWQRIGSAHTFDAVAARILSDAQSLPSRRPASTSKPAPDLTDFKQAYQIAIKRLRTNGLTKTPKILHLSASEATMVWLFEETDGTYLSGGFGAGPWHLELPDEEPSTREERFDLIIVDQLSIFGTGPQGSTRIRTLAHRLKRPGGVIALPCPPQDDCIQILCSAGMNLPFDSGAPSICEWP